MDNRFPPKRPTPPMLINQISRMFDERMRENLPAGASDDAKQLPFYYAYTSS